jgi:hypothetical protein
MTDTHPATPPGTPEVIARYYLAAGDDDVDALVECFTEDAWVVDEGERREGRGGIRTWRGHTAATYVYTQTVRSVTQTGPDEWAADTHLVGDFPGGEADLTQVFELRDGLIAHLRG